MNGTALSLTSLPAADHAPADHVETLAATTALVAAYTDAMGAVAGNCDESAANKLVASMANACAG